MAKGLTKGQVATLEALRSGTWEEARAAAEALTEAAFDMADIRWAVPALATALGRGNTALRNAAAAAIRELAVNGGHIEIAVPALLLHASSDDLEFRRCVWSAVGELVMSATGHPKHFAVRLNLGALTSFVEVAAKDGDEEIRRSAEAIAKRLP